LSLKSAFALLGMGAYLSIFTHLSINIIAVICCLCFIILNLLGAKEAGFVQVLLVFGLLGILLCYIFLGAMHVEVGKFSPFFSSGINPIFTTASFVFISFGGLTKIAALAEETKNPGKNIPLGMISALSVICVLYAAVIYVTIGVMNPQTLKETLTPISDGAGVFGGSALRIVISVAAFLAFISTANAGIMAASRYPLGMSRDKLLPLVFQKVSSKFGVPYIAILFTGLFMLAIILLLRLELLVKVASSVLIILFLFANLTVILFREGKILSYRPKFYSPLYPYLQIVGILAGIFLLIEMGSSIVFLTLVFLSIGVIWYKAYAQKRAAQQSALIYVMEKMVAKDQELATESLLTELRDIVIKRDNYAEDRFHNLLLESRIVDIEKPMTMEAFFKQISEALSVDLGIDSEELFKKFYEREMQTSTVIRDGLAIPHIVINVENAHRIVLVRARTGIIFPGDKLVHVAFVLVGSSARRGRSLHLKDLVAIAQITQDTEFDKKWLEAKNEEELRSLLLLAERRRE
jgi:amino acid permease